MSQCERCMGDGRIVVAPTDELAAVARRMWVSPKVVEVSHLSPRDTIYDLVCPECFGEGDAPAVGHR